MSCGSLLDGVGELASRGRDRLCVIDDAGAALDFTLRARLDADDARAAAPGGAALVFANPELKVSPGWPLPDVWLPIGSGVGVSLGERHRFESIRRDASRSCSRLRGSSSADVAGARARSSRAAPREARGVSA